MKKYYFRIAADEITQLFAAGIVLKPNQKICIVKDPEIFLDLKNRYIKIYKYMAIVPALIEDDHIIYLDHASDDIGKDFFATGENIKPKMIIKEQIFFCRYKRRYKNTPAHYEIING